MSSELSNAERLVAELVVKGHSNKEVAAALFVTEKTVKFHLTNIYKKMGVKSRYELIGKVGWVPAPSPAPAPEHADPQALPKGSDKS